MVFCTGIDSATDLAAGGGLDIHDRILVGHFLETSNPDIYAAGDVAEHPSGRISYLWHAAEHQGVVAARNMLGFGERFAPVAHRLKCEVFGRYFFSIGKPRMDVAENIRIEEIREPPYKCFYYRANEYTGAIMVDDSELAKVYELAVREGWPPQRVASELL